MTDPDSDPGRDVGDLLDLATDRLDAPLSAHRAWSEARRRRSRRTALAASGAVALVAIGAVLVTGVVRVPERQPSPATTELSTPTGTPDPTSAPPRSLDPDLVQGRWDPRRVDELPASSAEVRGVLPEISRPPTTSPDLVDDPIGIAVAVVPDDDGTSAQLLGTSGEWRTVELLGRSSSVALSPHGTRLLVRHSDASDEDASLVVDDLATGVRRRVPQPAGYEPVDLPRTAWLDEDRFLLDDGSGGWVVDLSSGDADRVPYPTHEWWAVDDSGDVVEVTGGPPRSAAVVDWRSGEGRVVADGVTGSLESVEVSEDRVAGTALRLTPDDVAGGSTTAAYAVVVADRRTGEPTAALPVLDVEGSYSGGGLGVAGVRDDGTVLLRVRAYGPDAGERVVAWDPESGSLTLVARLLVEDRYVELAQGLLTGGGP